jgi:hypothetical protein
MAPEESSLPPPAEGAEDLFFVGDESSPQAPAEAPGEVFVVGEEGLAAWCAALEERIAQLTRENGEFAAENERLAGRVKELSTILKALEEAFVIGRLRAGLSPVETPAPASPTFARAQGHRTPGEPTTTVNPERKGV